MVKQASDDKGMVSSHASALSSLGAAKGGRARADALSPEERSEIARAAAQARWNTQSVLPRETHSGNLEILPGCFIPCAVLNNGDRVLSTRGVSRAFGSMKTGTNNTRTGAPQPPPFLASQAIKPFISEELMALLERPIIYHPKVGGRTAFGYQAKLLPEICRAVMAADDAGALKPNQRAIAQAARALANALMGVAMIALVDEATGYQGERVRDELQTILKAYVSADLLPWVKRFPDEFFKHIYRLHEWPYNEGQAKHPQYIGKIINEWIYERLPPQVPQELRRMNPTINGRRRYKNHQFLTVDTGVPHLDHLVTIFIAIARVSHDKRMLSDLLTRALPKPGETLPLGTATYPADKAP